jgi:hypothetical protein
MVWAQSDYGPERETISQDLKKIHKEDIKHTGQNFKGTMARDFFA